MQHGLDVELEIEWTTSYIPSCRHFILIIELKVNEDVVNVESFSYSRIDQNLINIITNHFAMIKESYTY